MKGQLLPRIKSWGTSFILGVVVWLFFGVFYRYHLSYQEQLQFFLMTCDYLVDLLSRPGGLAIYLGRFFTQFFYNTTLGAFLLASLLVLLQRFVLDSANYIARKPVYTLLTCIPSLLFALLFCNEDVLLSGLIALILSFVSVAFYNRIGTGMARNVFLLLMTPVLYWLVGIGGILFPILVLLTEWIRGGYRRRLLILMVVISLMVIVFPYIAKAIVIQYPISHFWLAGDYYRFVDMNDLSFLYVCVISFMIPLSFKWLPNFMRKKAAWICEGCLMLLIVFITHMGVERFANWNQEEVMAYDYYSRTQKWDKIIAMADKKSPDGPLTVAILNLALGKIGHLPDHMFSYFQNGVEGLLLDFQKGYIVSVMGNEIYYHLGLVNTAQRFVFEGMETIPDYQKSVRCIKRLAETNLINGQYKIAEKYLHILTETLFYKKWAIETMAYLGDEDYINAHPEWGALRQYSLQEDLLFSDREKDMILGLLYQHNPENRMAYEYLLAYTLLTKDLQHFLTYYRMGEDIIKYPVIPKSYQEVLIYIWGLTNNEINAIPYPISNDVKSGVEAYRQMYTRIQNPEPMLRKQYSDTYWYYFHFRKQ